MGLTPGKEQSKIKHVFPSFPQAVCPHWGVLTVGVKGRGSIRVFHLGFSFQFSHVIALVKCLCAFRLRRLIQSLLHKIDLVSEMSMSMSTLQACTKSGYRVCRSLGPRHFSWQFSRRIALVRCPCAFRLPLRTKCAPPGSAAFFWCKFWHRMLLVRCYSCCKFLHKIAFERCSCACRLLLNFFLRGACMILHRSLREDLVEILVGSSHEGYLIFTVFFLPSPFPRVFFPRSSSHHHWRQQARASRQASKQARQASKQASQASQQATEQLSNWATEQPSKAASKQAGGHPVIFVPTASKQASTHARTQASQPASQQASKPASQQASKPASQPASKQASMYMYFLIFFVSFVFSKNTCIFVYFFERFSKDTFRYIKTQINKDTLRTFEI